MPFFKEILPKILNVILTAAILYYVYELDCKSESDPIERQNLEHDKLILTWIAGAIFGFNLLIFAGYTAGLNIEYVEMFQLILSFIALFASYKLNKCGGNGKLIIVCCVGLIAVNASWVAMTELGKKGIGPAAAAVAAAPNAEFYEPHTEFSF
jgi:hypothetical protein